MHLSVSRNRQGMKQSFVIKRLLCFRVYGGELVFGF